MEECKRDVVVLQAERSTLKAQTASLNIRVAEFHDEMKEMRRDLMAARSDVQKSKAERFNKFAIADAQISRLQSELAQTQDDANSRMSAGQQEKVNAELRHYKEKTEKSRVCSFSVAGGAGPNCGRCEQPSQCGPAGKAGGSGKGCASFAV